MLILAGVAVSIGLSGDSLFNKANEAKTSWNRGVNEEDTTLSNYIAYLDEYTGGGGTPTPGGLPTGWSSTAVADVVTETSTVAGVPKERKAPIPAGFKASIYEGETTIADGLVIYEANTDLQPDEGSTTTNHDAAMTTYNQYVWIPVDDINDMVMCESRTDASECDIDFVDGVLKCKNNSHSATATDLCGRLYGDNIDWYNPTETNGKYIYSGTMATTKAGQTYSANSGYREPAVVTGNSSGTGSSYDGSSSYSIKDEEGTSITGGTNGSNILAELKRQFNNMAKSVATYGGFYISRYEVGYDAITCTSKKGQVVMNVSTTANKGANMWYGLYSHIIGTKGGTTSQMIWGSEYDQVIKFIGSEAQTGHADRNLPGTNGSSDYRNSGATLLDKMKNIYDLEGNYYEWTAEANVTSSRAFRGGYYEDAANGSFCPASSRGSYLPDSTVDDSSSRQSLYVSL